MSQNLSKTVLAYQIGAGLKQNQIVNMPTPDLESSISG